MPFAPAIDPIPTGFVFGPFHVVPLVPAYNAPDYEAVMSSRALLRTWSDSPWPEDDFSLADNLADLAMHADEHERRVAFGYSVQDGTGRVLGSIYVNPLSESFDDYPVDEETRLRLAPYIGRVEFWLRADAVHLRPALLDAVRTWMAADWPWPVVYGSRRDMDDVRELYRQVGLTEQARLVSDAGRVQALFG